MLNDIASFLNRHCQCAGTDVPGLRRALDPKTGSTLAMSHPHLFSELPVFVSERDQAAMTETIRAIESVIALPEYQRLAQSGAPDIATLQTRPSVGILGYDFHITEHGPKLIEINTNPGGALLAAEMLKEQARCCEAIDPYISTGFESNAVEFQIVESFRREWIQARGTAPLKSIAIVDDNPASQYLHPEFLLFKGLLERHNVSAVIASPDELHLRNGRLIAGNIPIDLIYNRLTDFYLEDETNATLRKALMDGAVVMVPNPAAHVLYANKRNLTLLSNRDLLRSIGVANQDIDTLLRGIPETVRVNLGERDQWWARRKEWFFKPVSGYGSKGAYRGDKLTRGTFENIVQGQYVAQRMAQPAERTQDDDSSLKFDVRNFVYGGKTILNAARLYRGQTTNFRTEGGGFAPIYTPRDVKLLTEVGDCMDKTSHF